MGRSAIEDEDDAPVPLSALTALRMGSWDLDLGTDRFRCDDLTAALFGLSASEALEGVPMARVGAAVHPEDLALWQSRRTLSLTQGGSFDLVYRVMARSGVVRRILSRGRYVASAAGTLTGARGVVIDLTGEEVRPRARQGFDDVLAAGARDANAGLQAVAKHAIALHNAAVQLGQGSVADRLVAVSLAALEEVGLAIAAAAPTYRPPRACH